MKYNKKITVPIIVAIIAGYFFWNWRNKKTVKEIPKVTSPVTVEAPTSITEHTETPAVPTPAVPTPAAPTPAVPTPAAPTPAAYDGSYSKTASVTRIDSNSFTIATGFSSGVSWDLSLDGGTTYRYIGLTNSYYKVEGLTPLTTYQVVRRMHGINGFIESIPLATVITI